MLNLIILKVNYWTYFIIGCNQWHSRTNLICFQFNYNPLTNAISKNMYELLQSDYATSETGDNLLLGDSICSFIGYLRLFGIYSGSTAIIDGKIDI